MKNFNLKIIFTGFIFVLIFTYPGYSWTENWVDGTPYFNEQSRFLAEVLGHEDDAMLAPGALVNIPDPAYKIGDIKNFYSYNMANNSQYLVKASLRGVSDKAYIFVESGKAVTKSKVNSLLDAFENIYESITGHFGPPPDSIDGDPRIYLLLLDILDGNPADGIRMVGYYSPINQYKNTQLRRWSNQKSNEVEILYIDYISLNNAKLLAESVLTHEFTHMVQWARDPRESIWVNEGIAVYSEGLLGYNTRSRISAFEIDSDTSLISWSGKIADYGAAYLFITYISEQFGGVSAVEAIIRNRAVGVNGIKKALSGLGKSISFDNLFSNWVVANYLDDPELSEGEYGYSGINIKIRPSDTEEAYPIASKNSQIKTWSAKYIEFKKEQDDTLNLTVYNVVRDDIVAQIIEIGDETVVSSVKSSNENSGTTTIPVENSKAILVVTSQPDPPETNLASSTYRYKADAEAVVAPVTSISNKKITTWGKIKQD
ncbi:hypothetical protein GF312_08020 [Candidatus Poribacteria bacterium]|nr:hypothetical protein [Candidatus Poribacteria bacterium]